MTIGFSTRWRAIALGATLALGACGGGGSGDDGESLRPYSQLAAQCAVPRSSAVRDENGNAYPDRPGSLATEKSWVRSWIDETYLWYQDVRALGAATRDARNYPDPVSYFDALKSARDRFHFTEDTATWVALSASGVEYGYGFNVSLISSVPPRRAIVAYADTGSPAAAAGITRGAEILTIDGVDLANDNTDTGIAILNEGLFPTRAGSHSFLIRDLGAATTRTVVLGAAAQTLVPVRNAKTLPAPNQNVGYLQFDAHIATSESLLVAAFTQLANAGVTDLVLDLRYNGGGLLDIAAEVAYMVAGLSRTAGRVFERTIFNDRNPFGVTPAQASTPFLDRSQGFSGAAGQPLPSLNLSRVYVLSTRGTCSASEAIVNGLRGVGVQVHLIGDVTCGKPYGFLPTDNCSTTYFAIQFSGVNDLGFGDYENGFAPTCYGADDFSRALGDPSERLLALALGHRASGGLCPSVAVAQQVPRTAAAGRALQRPPTHDNRILRAF